MKRNCNLTLHLVPPSFHRQESFVEEVDEDRKQNQNQEDNQTRQLTIFYGGRVNVCDVTDIQAKAIIKLAAGELEKEETRRSRNATSPLMMQSPAGLLMKKSLQRFLQKRKHRILHTSPYPR